MTTLYTVTTMYTYPLHGDGGARDMPYMVCTECYETRHSSDGWSREWRLCQACGSHTWFTPAERVTT